MTMRARDVTPRQLAAIRAHLATGTVKGAAEVLGISPLTVRDLIADARIRVGVETNEQLVLVLARRGRLSVPRDHSAGVTRAV